MRPLLVKNKKIQTYGFSHRDEQKISFLLSLLFSYTRESWKYSNRLATSALVNPYRWGGRSFGRLRMTAAGGGA